MRRLAVDLSKLPAGMARYFITTSLRSPLTTPTPATGFEENGS